MWRRVIRQLFVFWALCIGTTVSLAAEPLVLALSRTPLSLPFFIAEKKEFFAAEGLPIKIVEVIGGHRSLQQVIDGQADLATSSETVVMFNSFQRSDYAVIATFVTSDDDTKIVASKDSGITRVDQLAGKRVATVVGGSSHYYLDTTFYLNGIDPKSVQVKNLQPEAMADALNKGDVDAIAIWEPFPFMALQTLPGSRVLPKSGPYATTFNLIARKDLRGARDDDLVKLLRALDRAAVFIKTEPAQAKAILRDRLQLDQSFIEWIWPRYNYRLSLDQSLLKTLEAEARWARREGSVKGDQSPNYMNFVYTKPLRSVRAAAVGIVE